MDNYYRSTIISLIQSSIVTEKAVNMQQSDWYAFRVGARATKKTVAQAVTELFGVDVLRVRVLVRKPEIKRGRFGVGKTKQQKIAYVKLASGQRIDAKKLATGETA